MRSLLVSAQPKVPHRTVSLVLSMLGRENENCKDSGGKAGNRRGDGETNESIEEKHDKRMCLRPK